MRISFPSDSESLVKTGVYLVSEIRIHHTLSQMSDAAFTSKGVDVQVLHPRLVDHVCRYINDCGCCFLAYRDS